MSTFLVTGGAGFIGSNLVRALLEKGHAVRVLDDFSTGRAANLAGLESSIALTRGDLTDARAVAEAMGGCDYVLHQAALPSVPRSIEHPLETDRVNVFGTLNVLQAAREAKVKRVVFAASSSAYGETPTLPKVESMSPDPLSPYAASKLACEYYASVYTRCYGLETVCLRYFNVFGPRQDPQSHYAAVIPRFVTAALAGRSPTIYGDGTQSRDFCFIANAIEANLLACTAPHVAGKMFNIACGVRTTLLDVVNELSSLLGRQIQPEFAPERAGDIKHSLADITAARRELGYTAPVSFRDGLMKTMEFYRCAA